MPHTYDGTAKRDILNEANDRTDEAFPGLKKKDFLQWLERRASIVQEVSAKHGGVVRYTDEMILSRWEKLTVALEAVYKHRLTVAQEQERQEQLFARITDVTVFMGGDGYWRIKCRIDGIPQMSERMADHEMTAISKGTSAKVFAAQKYESILAQLPGEQVSTNIKR